MATPAFDYTNHSPRPSSRWLKAASLVMPGIRRVQGQITPYANSWTRANQAALQHAHPLWVVIGDSMSQGIGASSYDKGWVGLLQHKLTDRGQHYRVINLSMSGARVRDALDLQLPVLRQLDVKPELVTVLIGANNLLRAKYRKPFLQEFSQLLGELPDGTVIGSLTGPSPEATQGNALLQEQAANRRFKIASMEQAFRPPVRDMLAQDFFHPNDRGYAAIADVFEAAING